MNLQDPSQFCHPSQESKGFPSFFPLPLCLMNFKKWSPKNILCIPPSHPYSLILGSILSISGLDHWNKPLVVPLPLASSLLFLILPSAFPCVASRALLLRCISDNVTMSLTIFRYSAGSSVFHIKLCPSRCSLSNLCTCFLPLPLLFPLCGKPSSLRATWETASPRVSVYMSPCARLSTLTGWTKGFWGWLDFFPQEDKPCENYL